MSTRRVESFLLRLVTNEDEDAHPQEWRGRIQHVATGHEQQIGELDEVVSFIASHLGRVEVQLLPQSSYSHTQTERPAERA